MSNALDLEDSALLAKLKGQINQLEDRVGELEENVEISEDVYSVIEQNAEISDVQVVGDEIYFDLSDGRTITIPLEWSWKLEQADAKERHNYELSDDQNSVEWPDVDEHISVHGILLGSPAPRPENE